MRFNGQPVQVRNPQEARALGISMVFQHFSLFDTLTVAENVWLGLGRLMTDSGLELLCARVRPPGLPVSPGDFLMPSQRSGSAIWRWARLGIHSVLKGMKLSKFLLLLDVWTP